ncbi:MAG: hypothetical protein WCA10_16435 [Terracidiphilus sp.]
MNESPGALELLSNRVDELEKRVHALEHADAAPAPAIKPALAAASARLEDGPDSLQTANIFPLLGRAMLGIGGGYVLRAIAEAGVMPKGVAAAVAIAYALAWLLWAVRAPRLSAIVPLVYTGTSMIILVPMLWEETLHFRVFAPVATAGVLAAFVIAAAILEWRQKSSPVLWIVYGAVAAAAIALSVATHAMAPFVLVLLLVVLQCEGARALSRSRPMWPLVALAADATVWAMIFVYSGPQNARPEYPELSVAILLLPALLLFAISAASVVVRVFLQGSRIGVVEIVQGMTAFGLAVSSVLYFAPRMEMILGVACLMLSAATYGASFHYLRQLPDPRDFRVFNSWSAALLIAGALWTLPRSGASTVMAVAGLVAYFFAERMELPILELQGAVFFCTAALVSDVANSILGALAGAQPGRPAWVTWIIGGTAAIAYFSGKDSGDAGSARQVLRFVAALLGVSATAALMIHGMLTLAKFAIALDAPHIAFLRTLAISMVSLLLAFAGSRWGRITMTRLAYVALAFLAAKLIFEDLRHGHMEFIAGSIFLFAITLIAVPGLVRMGAKSCAESHAKTPVHAPN